MKEIIGYCLIGYLAIGCVWVVYSWNKWLKRVYYSPMEYLKAMTKGECKDIDDEIMKSEGLLVWLYLILGIFIWPAFVYSAFLMRDDINEFGTDLENDIKDGRAN